MKKFCTLLLSILFISCTTSIKKNTLGTGCLRFQNYNQEVTILPDEFRDMINEKSDTDSCFLNLIEIFSNQEENVSTFLMNFLGKFICPSSKKNLTRK